MTPPPPPGSLEPPPEQGLPHLWGNVAGTGLEIAWPVVQGEVTGGVTVGQWWIFPTLSLRFC